MKEGFRSKLRRSFLLVLRSKKACIGAVMLLLIFSAALFSEQLMPYDPTKVVAKELLAEPSAEHWFGTDNFGRDILSRVMEGSRITFFIAICTVAIGCVAGSFIGAVTGYFGGIIDTDEILIGELEAFKSDYFYCDKCKILEGE